MMRTDELLRETKNVLLLAGALSHLIVSFIPLNK